MRTSSSCHAGSYWRRRLRGLIRCAMGWHGRPPSVKACNTGALKDRLVLVDDVDTAVRTPLLAQPVRQADSRFERLTRRFSTRHNNTEIVRHLVGQRQDRARNHASTDLRQAARRRSGSSHCPSPGVGPGRRRLSWRTPQLRHVVIVDAVAFSSYPIGGGLRHPRESAIGRLPTFERKVVKYDQRPD